MKEKDKQIINSLLWTDLYKITMGQAVYDNYGLIGASYSFVNRGKTKFPEGFKDKLETQLDGMSKLSLTDKERNFLEVKTPYLKPAFLDFLSGFRFDPNEVLVDQQDGDLKIDIKGPWQNTIYWEVPLMTTISELYFRETGRHPGADFVERAAAKGQLFREHGAKIIDFGTRRAFSTSVHEEVLKALIKSAGSQKDGGALVGTSNPFLAMKYDLPPVGTYAHEWVMAHAAIFGVKNANVKANQVWSNEYPGLLKIALPDTYTTDKFLEGFTKPWATYFDGLRQDSGDPFKFADKLISHYKNLGIDPQDKKIVFSDGLDPQTVINIENHCKNKIQSIYGIGTNLTNDVGVTPLNMVIKLFSVILPGSSEVPVAKLSDVPGKVSGDPVTVSKTIQELNITKGAA